MNTAPNDYTGQQDEPIPISSSVTESIFPVPIEDDNLTEEELERFTASLTLVTVNPRVTIAPEQADIFIQDNDSK